MIERPSASGILEASQALPATSAPIRATPREKPTFDGGGAFHAALRARADEYFRSTGKRPRGSPLIFAKAAICLGTFALCYGLLIFVAPVWWIALPLAIALGFSMAGIGFNIMHDAGHQAFSKFRSVNRVLAWSLDMIGGSSFLWHLKHNVIHHTYTNITPVDTSIAMGGLGRLTPHEAWQPLHRWQHWYMWPLYGVVALKWHLYDDFQQVLSGRLGNERVPRPRRWDLVVFIGGKLVFFTLAFGIPLLIHEWWLVVGFYALVSLSLSLPLSIVTQVAHCVEPAHFWQAPMAGERMSSRWAEHQVESSTDFARHSWWAAWLFGGLNFQIEHHVFPRISHIHYPALSKIVEDTCREFGVRYTAYGSVASSVVAHLRWLRKLGRPETVAS